LKNHLLLNYLRRSDQQINCRTQSLQAEAFDKQRLKLLETSRLIFPSQFVPFLEVAQRGEASKVLYHDGPIFRCLGKLTKTALNDGETSLVDMVDTSCEFVLSELRSKPFYSKNDPQDNAAKVSFTKDELGGHLVSLIALIDNKCFFVGSGKGHLTAADVAVYALLVRLQKELPGVLDYFPLLGSWLQKMHQLDFIEGMSSASTSQDLQGGARQVEGLVGTNM
jgi:glutathione S-transferase